MLHCLFKSSPICSGAKPCSCLDRRHAQNETEINVKAKLEIELLHEKIDILKEQELMRLTDSVRDLSAQPEKISNQLLDKR